MNSDRLPKLIFFALLFVVVLILALTSDMFKWGKTENLPSVPGQKTSETRKTPERRSADPEIRKLRNEKFVFLKSKLSKLTPWIPPTVAGKYHFYLGESDEYVIVDLPDISDIANDEERFFYYWKSGNKEGNTTGTIKRKDNKLVFSDLGEGYLVVDNNTPYLVFEDKILKKQQRK
jgi:hypothetical protein